MKTLIIFLAINSIFIFTILKFCVSNISQKKDFLFSVLTVSLITFLLTYYLKGLDVQIGLALGLFAIFSIIRFRTSRIPIDQMAIIFLSMGISVINSLNSSSFERITDLLIINFSILAFVFIFRKLS